MTRSRIRMIVRAVTATAAFFVTLGVDIPAAAVAAGALALETVLQVFLRDSELDEVADDGNQA